MLLITSHTGLLEYGLSFYDMTTPLLKALYSNIQRESLLSKNIFNGQLGLPKKGREEAWKYFMEKGFVLNRLRGRKFSRVFPSVFEIYFLASLFPIVSLYIYAHINKVLEF